MSLHPLYDPNSIDDQSLNLYAHSITCDNVNGRNVLSRSVFEPVFKASLINYTDIKSCQSGVDAPFAWVLQQDETTATIYGQFQMTGDNKDEAVIFALPTSYDVNNNNNICITSMGRSRDINGNPNGSTFNVYQCDIIISNGIGVMRLFWRSNTNANDPVSDDKFFYFTATYKK